MSEKFFQFQLSLLAAGKDVDEKRDMIIASATMHAGLQREQKIGHASAKAEVDGKKLEVAGFKSGRWDHRAWALGKDVVGFSWHSSFEPCLKYHELANQFLAAAKSGPRVRILQSVIQDFHSGVIQPREFYVLCAVYAILGDKKYTIVRRDRVRAGALGYNSAHDLFDKDGKITEAGEQLLARRDDKARPLSLAQVRYTLDNLHRRKFFARIQPRENGRAVWYSRSLSHDDLANLLFDRLARKDQAQFSQHSAQDRLREKAATLLKRLNSGENSGGDSQNPPGIRRGIAGGLAGGVTA